jgi:hypothetical protein
MNGRDPNPSTLNEDFGFVGVGTNLQNFIGLRNYRNSNPAGLGFEVFKTYQQRVLRQGRKGTWSSLTHGEFIDLLLQYDEWGLFVTRGRCVYCGKRVGNAAAQAIGHFLLPYESAYQTRADFALTREALTELVTSQGGSQFDLDVQLKALQNFEQKGIPDPEMDFHHHGKPLEGGELSRAQLTPAWLGKWSPLNVHPNSGVIEWGYLFDPAEPKLRVFDLLNGDENRPVILDLRGQVSDWSQVELDAGEVDEELDAEELS